MKIGRKALLFSLGGAGYVGLELAFRGRSHISMFLAGGLCFLLIGGLNHVRPRLPLGLRALAGAGIVTMVELAVGLLVNRQFQVWDYRDQPLNFLGQICPVFSALWLPVSLLALGLYAACEGALERWAGKAAG